MCAHRSRPRKEEDVDASLDLARVASLLAATPHLLREEVSAAGDEIARWHPSERDGSTTIATT